MADSINLQLGRHAMQLASEEWGDRSLKPIGAALRELMTESRQSCEVIGEWYLVSIEHQQQDLAKHEVVAKGAVPYLPVVPRRERHGRGSERTVWRPMFGCYMFVKCPMTVDAWGSIMACRGVRRFLGQGGRPLSIGDREMEVVRLVESQEAETERVRLVVEEAAAKARAGGRSGMIWHFTEGDRVRIKNGPLAGFYAQLDSAVDVHDRLTALVNILGGQTVVELSAFDIEAT